MRDGEGFLLVYSLTERSTFVPMSKISEQIKRVKDTDHKIPIILVGNKVCPSFCLSVCLSVGLSWTDKFSWPPCALLPFWSVAIMIGLADFVARQLLRKQFDTSTCCAALVLNQWSSG